MVLEFLFVALKQDFINAINSTETPKVLVCCNKSLDILNSYLNYAEVIDLGFRSIDGIM